MTTRFSLFLIWFLSYLVCLVSILSFQALGYALSEQIPAYLTKVTGIYAPYITPILSFWFAEDIKGQHRRHTRHAILIAFITSSFYNIIMIVILMSVFVSGDQVDEIEDTLLLMQNVATLLAFISGPAIGYFFSKVEPSNSNG